MLISHEVPIAYLKDSYSYNDYDYCLVHLCDKYPEYLKYYKEEARRLRREVLLDNSIFELGTAYDPVKFAERIEEIIPSYYVVPDVLEDINGTIKSWEAFEREYKGLPGLKIGVVQGKTYQDIVDCYQFMSAKADYLAISFDYSLYQVIAKGHTKLERQANGRAQVIQQLQIDGVWNYSKPHHLLGCSLASEFKAYRHDKSIRSLDTSNPIVAALEGVRYVRGIGLRTKSSVKLADLIDAPMDLKVHCDIGFNTAQFKFLVNEQ